MKLPIVIDSNFDFALIGPTGNNDGVIIKSKNSKTELIGYANLLYNDRNVESRRLFDFNYRVPFDYCWSDYISFYFDTTKINVENRKFKVLLVWTEKTSSFSGNKDEIQRTLDRIIFDLYKIAFNERLTMDEKKNSIDWIISPLIFLGSRS